ncbi:MAG TPA: Zn-dependent hydrolase [Actinomycetota bacterium]|nr:Zn-dependent hydrolase [Actinomycetota bacterium]
MKLDAERLWSALGEVNRIGATPAGGAERLAWSDQELQARRWFAERAGDAGLEVSWDPAGNVWGFGGLEPAVVLGSHLDTVPDGGRFDGALGIVAALEVVGHARRQRLPGSERLALVCFSDEEGVRFGLGMAGSRAVSGTLQPAEIAAARDSEGVALSDLLGQHGFDPARVPEARANLARMACYLELHVEQGIRLERLGAPIGVVTAIVGLSDYHIEVTGEANHAGTTAMEDRRDALLPVAHVALAAREVMSSSEGVVATVGEAWVTNGAPNIVPGKAGCILDVRAAGEAAIEAAADAILDAGRTAAEAAGCQFEARLTKRLPPAPMDEEVVAALAAAAADLAPQAPELVSRAGHDAMSLAPAGVPCGMLFVASQGGISHSPLERSSERDCVLGAEVLGAAALALAQR